MRKIFLIFFVFLVTQPVLLLLSTKDAFATCSKISSFCQNNSTCNPSNEPGCANYVCGPNPNNPSLPGGICQPAPTPTPILPPTPTPSECRTADKGCDGQSILSCRSLGESGCDDYYCLPYAARGGGEFYTCQYRFIKPTPIGTTASTCRATRTISVNSYSDCAVANCPPDFRCDAKSIPGPRPDNTIDCVCMGYAAASTPAPTGPPPPCFKGLDLSGTPTQNKSQIVKCTQVDSALGPIDTDVGGLIRNIFLILLSMSGAWAVYLIITAGYQLMIAGNNPESEKEAKEKITSAIIGLIFMILSIAIIQIIGVDIFAIPGFSAK